MRALSTLSLLATLGLAAQTAAPEATPALKWRGALWASAAASDRQTGDGSLFLRSMDATDGQLALDGLQLGADLTLKDGWSLKLTLLGGQTAKVLNATSLETGTLALPEAMLVWTGAQDIVRLGRMYTPMGMEVLDQTLNATASRGLLFTYALPLGQVGVNWHHAFTPSWSADGYLTNGEDRIQDNNHGKTAGLGITYNHTGAADRFVTVMAFSGPEQDGLGSHAHTGVEGRKRERLCMTGQWVWGASTLQWEGELAREAFPAGSEDAAWSGFGFIYKRQFSPAWAASLRAETLKDDQGVRLAWDPTVAAAGHTDLKATSFALGVERRWNSTYSRLEVRRDSLNRDVNEGAATGSKAFRDATSLTWSFGTSF